MATAVRIKDKPGDFLLVRKGGKNSRVQPKEGGETFLVSNDLLIELVEVNPLPIQVTLVETPELNRAEEPTFIPSPPPPTPGTDLPTVEFPEDIPGHEKIVYQTCGLKELVTGSLIPMRPKSARKGIQGNPGRESSF